MLRRRSGFTLIELLITMVVLAILASIALPMYTDYVRRGKIPEATSNLLAMRTKMEQFYQDNRSYNPGGAIVTPCQPGSSVAVPTLKYFTITCNIPSGNQYTITASGGVSGGDQSMAGITYTIDQSNNRVSTVTSGSTMDQAGYAGNASCWVTKKGGAC